MTDGAFDLGVAGTKAIESSVSLPVWVFKTEPLLVFVDSSVVPRAIIVVALPLGLAVVG